MDNLLELRAELARREEDSRIARKHCDEAASRGWTPSNAAAYRRACAWVAVCENVEADRRKAVIEAVTAEAIERVTECVEEVVTADEKEVRERLVQDEWMLRDVDTAFESVPRSRPDNLRRVCKLCDERVQLWQREKHLRAHKRTRESIRKQAQAKTDAARAKALERARAARAGA